MRSRSSLEMVYLFAGPVIWAVHFFLIYGINALLCARVPGLSSSQWLGQPVSTWIILATSVLGCAALLWLILRPPSAGFAGGRSRFLTTVGRTLCGLSLVAVIWQTLPVLLVSECG
jgi:hypothetical protein